MINFILGITVGAALAPFWKMLYASQIKPVVEKLLSRK